MFTYVAMRRRVKELTQYHFYNADDLTKVGYVIPGWSTLLRHRRTQFRYINDPDITCFPGCSQAVYMDNSEEEVARIFWDGLGKHRIQTAEGTFDVTYQDGVYSFSWKGFRFAVMSKYQEGTPFSHPWGRKQHPDKECWMVMLANTEPPNTLALLMLSFPLLQIRP